MPLTPEVAVRKKRIAESLVRFETDTPGAIRLKPNPYLARSAAEALAQVGFRKRVFALPQQFVIDCFLTHVAACDHLLGECALMGPRDPQSGFPAWSGTGRFRAWMQTLPEFQPADPILFAINVAEILFRPISEHEVFCDLLEEPTPDMNSESMKQTLELLRKLRPKE